MKSGGPAQPATTRTKWFPYPLSSPFTLRLHCVNTIDHSIYGVLTTTDLVFIHGGSTFDTRFCSLRRRNARLLKIFGEGMTATDLVLLVVAVLTFGYLCVALIRPEKF